METPTFGGDGLKNPPFSGAVYFEAEWVHFASSMVVERTCNLPRIHLRPSQNCTFMYHVLVVFLRLHGKYLYPPRPRNTHETGCLPAAVRACHRIQDSPLFFFIFQLKCALGFHPIVCMYVCMYVCFHPIVGACRRQQHKKLNTKIRRRRKKLHQYAREERQKKA